MKVIHSSLVLSDFCHAMMWAACCLLAFLVFLRAEEFSVNSPYDPTVHLPPDDLQPVSTSNLTCLRVHIKCSKTDPFHQGCFISLVGGRTSICPIAAIVAYLHLRGPAPGPVFIHKGGQPLTRRQLSDPL